MSRWSVSIWLNWASDLCAMGWLGGKIIAVNNENQDYLSIVVLYCPKASKEAKRNCEILLDNISRFWLVTSLLSETNERRWQLVVVWDHARSGAAHPFPRVVVLRVRLRDQRRDRPSGRTYVQESEQHWMRKRTEFPRGPPPPPPGSVVEPIVSQPSTLTDNYAPTTVPTGKFTWHFEWKGEVDLQVHLSDYYSTWLIELQQGELFNLRIKCVLPGISAWNRRALKFQIFLEISVWRLPHCP